MFSCYSCIFKIKDKYNNLKYDLECVEDLTNASNYSLELLDAYEHDKELLEFLNEIHIM